MNSRTIDRKIRRRSFLALVLPVLMLMGSGIARAQIVVANPLEWAVLVEGNELINSQINSEIEGQTQTAVLQGTIAAEFTQIKNWENNYNSYLKSVDGYASSLKAATPEDISFRPSFIAREADSSSRTSVIMRLLPSAISALAAITSWLVSFISLRASVICLDP